VAAPDSAWVDALDDVQVGADIHVEVKHVEERRMEHHEREPDH